MADVQWALQLTEKGQLNYDKPWEKCSRKEKMQILDELTAIPFSVELLRWHFHTKSPDIVAGAQDEAEPDEISDDEEREEQPTTPSPVSDARSLLPKAKSPLKQAEEQAWDYSQSLEDEIMDVVETSARKKRRLFDAERERIRHETEHRRSMEKRARDAKREEERELEKSFEEERMVEEEREIQRKNEEYERHAKSVRDRVYSLQEEMLRQTRELEEKRKKEIEQLHHQCRQISQEAAILLHQLNEVVRSCHYPQLVSQETSSRVKEAQEVARAVRQGCAEQDATDDPQAAEVNRLKDALYSAISILADTKQAIQEINRHGALLEKQHVEELRKKAENERRRAEEPTPVVERGREKEQQQVRKDEPLPSTVPPAAKQKGVVAPVTALSWYNFLRKKLQDATETTSPFTESKDPQVKKQLFSLLMAMNTLVSTITSTSGSFLIDKIRRLQQLLSGQTVTVGPREVSIRQHPLAGLCCVSHLAEKLVKQGGEQTKVEGVFAVASVVVHLWAEFPQFGDFFLAHCHAMCPVLVPMYFNKTEGMSDEEFLRLQGFKKTGDSSWEDLDLYLKRMAAYIRLYAAVLLSQPVLTKKPHPHGLDHAWTWLARMLNTEPEVNLTATALYQILELCGNAMWRRFGCQFTKLIRVMVSDYLPKIKKITPETEMGPYTRLEIFLESVVNKGQIPEPKGMLTESFWKSRATDDFIVA